MESLAAEIRCRLGEPPRLANTPLISIVVVNRNGVPHLRRLLAGLEGSTDYPRFELVLIDNASSDESVEVVRSAKADFPVAILANDRNESFSDACNQGAARASGELLLFLNNDTEPFEAGWLRELVACLEKPSPGLVGTTLLQPDRRAKRGYSVQHRAMGLREEDGGLLRADLYGRGDDPLGPELGLDADTPIAAGACMLLKRDLFEEIGGFTPGFLYGGEDIDLGFKVLDAGRRVICSGRSLPIHRLGSTRAKSGAEWQASIGERNRRLLWERWGPRIRREFELDRLAGRGFWTRERHAEGNGPTRKEVIALGFCLKSSVASGAVTERLDRLAEKLRRRGHRCLSLQGGRVDDLIGLSYDVAIHLDGAARLAPAQLNVLWLQGGGDAPPAGPGRYDLIRTGSDPEELIDAILARAKELGLPKRFPEFPP